MHHSTPNALSIGDLSLSTRSRPLISIALSSAGTDIITFLLLLTNFGSLNPPFAHISLTACTSSTRPSLSVPISQRHRRKSSSLMFR